MPRCMRGGLEGLTESESDTEASMTSHQLEESRKLKESRSTPFLCVRVLYSLTFAFEDSDSLHISSVGGLSVIILCNHCVCERGVY
jgi:hypothetical protein